MTANQLARAHEGSSSDYLLVFRDQGLPDTPVELVPLHALTVAYTPRVAGEDGEYALELAESPTTLPPILVHRASMTVVDGVHRLRAAALRGQEHIEVRFFDGGQEDATLLAVAMNISHGRPLSLEDRTAAAERIFASRPQWSDRAVALVTGLSARRVSDIRLRSTTGVLQWERRVGLDGRARPLNSTHGRELASQLIKDDPQASLRTIARKAGISPSTVADVRDRVRRGDDPVPPMQRGLAAVDRTPGRFLPPAPDHRLVDRKSPLELLSIFDLLRRDPSLRLNEMGRNILRMLDACALVARDRQKIIANVPPHCKGNVSELMQGYADLWRALAEELREYDALAG